MNCLEDTRIFSNTKVIDDLFPIVMVSGYFDPIQPGHIDYFRFAKEGKYIGYACVPYVITVIHTSEDIIRKSGFYIYEADELIQILNGFSNLIDKVTVAIDTDGTVIKTIGKIRPRYFIKGPDRNPKNMPQGELEACAKIGCEVIYQPGSKINNSSNIKDRIRKQFAILEH